jgi:hypothetical protein
MDSLCSFLERCLSQAKASGRNGTGFFTLSFVYHNFIVPFNYANYSSCRINFVTFYVREDYLILNADSFFQRSV